MATNSTGICSWGINSPRVTSPRRQPIFRVDVAQGEMWGEQMGDVPVPVPAGVRAVSVRPPLPRLS